MRSVHPRHPFLALWLCLLVFSTPVFSEGIAPGDNAGDNPSPPHETLDSLFNQYQPYLKNISAYEPIFFLAGTDPEESRFQFSLKYRFIDPDAPGSRIYPWAKGFHIAYTQTSYWDLSADSEPFEDSSYKPEVFFLSPNLASGDPFHTFMQIGYQHESNGRGGDESRSTNFLYLKPIFIFYHPKSRLGLQFAPKIWTYVANEEENRDIYRYRGYIDIELTLGEADGLVFESHWYRGEKGLSVQHDMTYPLDRLIDLHLQVYLQLEYVNALSETLLNYTERTRAIRLGFAIVR